MKVESIAECSLGAFCNTFDLHYAIIGLEKQNNFLSFLSGLLRQVLLYTVQWLFNLRSLKKNSDRPTHTGKTGLDKGKEYFQGWPEP